MGITARSKSSAQLPGGAVALGSFFVSIAFVVVPSLYVWLNRAQFPATVPTHWGFDSHPNSWSSLPAALGRDIGLVVLTSALFLGIGYATRMLEAFAPLAPGLSAMLSTLTLGSIFAVARAVASIGPVLLAAVVVGAVVGLLAHLLLRGRIRSAAQGGTFTAIDPGEETARVLAHNIQLRTA